MKVNELGTAEFKKYFEARLQGQSLRRSGSSYAAKCPFHDDRTPSLSVNFEKGVWKCWSGAGCGGGGVIDFEMKFARCDKEVAMANIAEIMGLRQGFISGQRWEAAYDYTDEYGHLLYQVIRYPKDNYGKKKISFRHPDEQGGWVWSLDKCRRALYRLPDIITAREVLVFEGEKKVDLVRRDLEMVVEVAATCNSGGAEKWLDEYSPFLTGKKVIIFPDNDEKGEKHALQVANSIYRYAAGVKVVKLPGLPLKGDVVDWYAQGHQFGELVKEANQTPAWRPSEVSSGILVDVVEFTRHTPPSLNWMVEGLIQSGANGMIIARPKAGKSLLIADLCICLAAGLPWLPGNGGAGFYVERPARVAYVTREDAPQLTQWRLKKLARGREVVLEDIKANLYVNSRQEKQRLMIDDEDDRNELIRALEKHKTEFLVLDVFRRLHTAEENDNTAMQRVIDNVALIQEKTGCQVTLIHHETKGSEEATLTERIRGASAIAGYAEWVLGLRVVNRHEAKHEWVRLVEIEIKAALSPDNFYIKYIDQNPPQEGITVERVRWEPPRRGNKKSDGLQSEYSNAEEAPF